MGQQTRNGTHWARRVAALAATLTLGLTGAVGTLTVGAPSALAGYVLEPAMEAVVRQLAKVPAGAPEGVQARGASLDRDHIVLRFAAPDGKALTFRLDHPEQGPEGARNAGALALSGDLDALPALTDALVTAVEALGGRIRWKLSGTSGAATGQGPSPLAVARSRATMQDPKGVEAALDQALESGGGELNVLRDAAAIARAAGLTDKAQSLINRADAALAKAKEAGTPGLAADASSLHVLKAQDLATFLPKGELDTSEPDGSPACAWTRVADTLLLLDALDAAGAWADAVLAQDASCARAHHLGAEVASRNKDWAGLLERTQAARRAVPKDSGFKVREATALRGLERYHEARDLLESVARDNPHDSGTMSSLANLTTMTMQGAEAFDQLAQTCDEQRDKDIVTCFQAGVLAHYEARHSECVRRMEALLDVLPNQPRVPMYAAISAYYAGDEVKAKRLIAQAAAISGATDPDVYYCRALITMRDDRPQAISDLEKFLKVAHLGWHSKGKIGRVTSELEMLRRGEIPPPVEAHHRPEELQRGAADDLLRVGTGPPGGGLVPLYFTETRWDPDRIRFGFQTRADEKVTLTLEPPGEAGPTAPLTRYRALFEVEPPEAADGLKAAMDAVVERVRTNEARGPKLVVKRRASGGGAAGTEGPGADPSGAGATKGAQGGGESHPMELPLNVALLILSVLMLPWLVRTTAESQDLRASGLAWLVVVAVQLLWVPATLVTVFSGYASVAEAEALRPVAKYGAATTALYGPALHALGVSTATVIALNTALGLLALPLVGALAARFVPSQRAFVGAAAIALVGLSPLMLRDRASESILVPALVWMLAAAVSAEAWFRRGRRLDGLGAVVFGALALHARPEAWLAIPMWMGVTWALSGSGAGEDGADGVTEGRLRRVVLAGVGLLALGGLRLGSLLSYTDVAAGAGDVPGLANASAEGLWDRFTSLNALWAPDLHAVTATGLAALGVALVRGTAARLAAAGLVVLIVGWQALSTVDLPPVSVPRVQAPAIAWTLLLAAVTSAAVASRLKGAAGLALAAALALAVVVPRPAVLDTLWAETNAQAFDAWWTRSSGEFPAREAGSPRCLVALSMSDAPRDIVLRHYPMYDLGEGDEGVESYGVEAFSAQADSILGRGCEVLYVKGPQCSARFFGFDAPRPDELDIHPACVLMEREFALEPLAESTLDNHGNADFPFYGDSEAIRVGVYRVTGRSTAR